MGLKTRGVPRVPVDGWDVHDLARALERAEDRLDAATLKAEAARRAYFWSDLPAEQTREAFRDAMREEADARLAVEDARRTLVRARCGHDARAGA